ncbi:hypothetical protein BV25DRAFT_1916815 [Artomyces pyxidatus]|uniref:Uncharacterized protein n=1 Tax=Artomyces pyxidatus TaxID=48021 RepID=A0ACB8SZ25_9AGAM|nr:hypothetical protein BV25DRAFT_1916815 [Artomyces pyxidatus]
MNGPINLSTALTQLPAELIVLILCKLDYITLLMCTQASQVLTVCITFLIFFEQTCHKLRSVVQDNLVLLYEIALPGCGLRQGRRDHGEPGCTLAERLESLDRYEAAWRELRWTGQSILPEFEAHLAPEVVSGSTVACQNSEIEGPDGPMYIVHRLPSSLRGASGRIWSFFRDGFDFDFSAMDEGQDLAILHGHNTVGPLVFRFLFLSLSSGDLHPLACASGSIPLSDSREPRNKISICGDRVLGIIRRDHDDEGWYLYVWNWKTGAVELQIVGLFSSTEISFPDSPQPASFDFVLESCCFLDYDHIAIAISNAPDASSLVVVDCGKGATADVCRPSHHSFILPDFIDEPILAPNCSSFAPPTATDQGRFYNDHKDRLLTFFGRTRFRKGHGVQFVIDISVSKLLAYVASHPPSRLAVPWANWGPPRCRISQVQPPMQRTEFLVSGMRRLALSSPKEDGTGPLSLTVTDYHAGRVARARRRQQHADDDASESRVILGGEIDGRFTGAGHRPCKTGLSCIVTEISVPVDLRDAETHGPAAVLCDDGVFVFQYTDSRIGHALSYSI